jgi:hypothetical protein
LTLADASRPSPIWELFGSPSDWCGADRVRLTRYSVIGSDGAGNPLCVEQDSGAVWLLDHEDWFHTRQFVNTTVAQLAECLLAYMGELDPNRFRLAVRDVDVAALADGAFWWHEAAMLGS